MNKILQLFDEQYVIDLFKKKVIPKYHDFFDVKRVEIKKHKTNVWEDTYHVVIEFNTTFIKKDGTTESLPIFCSAHSEEPRKNVYLVLQYLWESGFNKGLLTIPHPLFYSNYFRGTFYRGVKGKPLYYYIREKNFNEIEEIVPKAAALFAKLHKLTTNDARNFNKKNSRIKTVIPGRHHILAKIKKVHPNYYNFYKKAYNIFISKEEKFLASTDKRWFIHGDAHPENIIKMSKRKIAMIDFTDFCLSDFARDLGCFLQQFEYMSNRKIQDEKYAEKIKNLFLKHYFLNVNIKLDDSLHERIENYYNWTAIRTTTFFLLQENVEIERAEFLINKIKNNLNF